MSDQTSILALPYILPSKAQKHVTHNEAPQRLDAIVQLCIAGESSLCPPTHRKRNVLSSKEPAGKDGMLALRQDGIWIYIEPGSGWRCFFGEKRQLRVFRSSEWHTVSLDNARLHRRPRFGLRQHAILPAL